MMYGTWYDRVDEVESILRGLRLNIPVMHCEKTLCRDITLDAPGGWETALHRFAVNCRIARSIGAEKIVIHLWDGEPSDKHIHRNIAAHGALSGIASLYGITLLVENVVCHEQDPMTHWRALAERYPGVRFVFDTKMAAFHNQLNDIFLPENRWLWRDGHIAHCHVNDYAGGYMDWQNLRTLPAGMGRLDISGFLRFLQEVDYAGDLTMEGPAYLPDGMPDIALKNAEFDRIRRALCQK